MRISDLSSDVCSSDLGRSANHAAGGQIGMEPLGVDKVMAVEPSRDGAGNIVLAIVDEQRAAGRDSEAAGREMIDRSEEHTSELQSLMRISYAVFCLKKKNNKEHKHKIRLSRIVLKCT